MIEIFQPFGVGPVIKLDRRAAVRCRVLGRLLDRSWPGFGFAVRAVMKDYCHSASSRANRLDDKKRRRRSAPRRR